MTKIYLEGKDTVFIRFLLKILFPSIADDIEIISTGGWTNLHNVAPKLKETSDIQGVNIIIFDADESQNKGGFQNRRDKILEIKEQLNVEFELFLFPNNSDDGDFELLLEKIINPDHQILLDCFSNYESCIIQRRTENGTPFYKLPLRKSKIYSYIDAFPVSRTTKERIKKGDYLFEDSNYWHVENEALETLKKFLRENIQ